MGHSFRKHEFLDRVYDRNDRTTWGNSCRANLGKSDLKYKVKDNIRNIELFELLYYWVGVGM